MATGLGLTLISAVANTTIKSSDYNSNMNAINAASAFAFATNQVDPALTPDSTFRGMKMITATDFGIDNHTSTNWLRLKSGLTAISGSISFTDLTDQWTHRFWDDGTYGYLDIHRDLRIRTNGTSSTGNNAVRISDSNKWTLSGTSYGVIFAANLTWSWGTANADIAEPLLTQNNPQPGMAVCIVDHDTVAPCVHDMCRVARIVSTQPTALMAPRVRENEHAELVPIPGHESAMPICVGGVVPVLLVPGVTPHLRDRLTTAGPAYPGMLRIAEEGEYSLGDIIKIERGVIYAWIHY